MTGIVADRVHMEVVWRIVGRDTVEVEVGVGVEVGTVWVGFGPVRIGVDIAYWWLLGFLERYYLLNTKYFELVDLNSQFWLFEFILIVVENGEN